MREKEKRQSESMDIYIYIEGRGEEKREERRKSMRERTAWWQVVRRQQRRYIEARVCGGSMQRRRGNRQRSRGRQWQERQRQARSGEGVGAQAGSGSRRCGSRCAVCVVQKRACSDRCAVEAEVQRGARQCCGSKARRRAMCKGRTNVHQRSSINIRYSTLGPKLVTCVSRELDGRKRCPGVQRSQNVRAVKPYAQV